METNDILKKFIAGLSNDKHTLPDYVEAKHINNISFQPISFDSNNYIVNVWFKNVPEIPNQTTFKYKHLSIDSCLKIKKELANKLINCEDDLFTSDETNDILVTPKNIGKIEEGSFFDC